MVEKGEIKEKGEIQVKCNKRHLQVVIKLSVLFSYDFSLTYNRLVDASFQREK